MTQPKPIDQPRKDNLNAYISAWLLNFSGCLSERGREAFERNSGNLMEVAAFCESFSTQEMRAKIENEALPEDIESARPSEENLAEVCRHFARFFEMAKRENLFDRSRADDIAYLAKIVEEQKIVLAQPNGYAPPQEKPNQGPGQRIF